MLILSLAVIFFVVKIGLLNKQNYIVKKFVEKKYCYSVFMQVRTFLPYTLMYGISSCFLFLS